MEVNGANTGSPGLSPHEAQILREAKRAQRRSRIKDELFETERAYIGHLQLVHKYFDFPLRFNCLIPDRTHAHIFSNIEQISEVNRHLLSHMEQATIGSAFLYLAPFLKLYSTYANNHEFALETLQEYAEKEAKFAEFLHTQEAMPELGGLKLNALLITPVQRIPRYKLLLEDLLDSTPTSHHDFSDIQGALSQAVTKISELATYINEQIRYHNHFHKMLMIQRSLHGPAPRILAPGRGFLKQGLLNKISRRHGRRLQERMFYLFTDMLVYAKPRLDGSFSCCAVYPLRLSCVQRLFGEYTKDFPSNGIVFKVTCQDESVHVYSPHLATGQAWFNAILHAIIDVKGDNADTPVERASTRRRAGCGRLGRDRSLVKKQKLEALGSPCIQPIRQQLKTLRQACQSPRQQCHTVQVTAATCLIQSPCLSPYKRRRRLIGCIQDMQQPITCGVDNPGVNLDECPEPRDLSIHSSPDSSLSAQMSDNSFTKYSVADIISDGSSDRNSAHESVATYSPGESQLLVDSNANLSEILSQCSSLGDKENYCANNNDVIDAMMQDKDNSINSQESETAKYALAENYDGNLRQELMEKYLIKADESRTSFMEDSFSSKESMENHGNYSETTKDSFLLVDEGLSSDNLNFSLDMFADRSRGLSDVSSRQIQDAKCTTVNRNSHEQKSTARRVMQTLHNSAEQLLSIKRDHCSVQ